MIDRSVVGYAQIFDLEPVFFPEFAYSAPIDETVEELRDRLAVPILNEQTERFQAKARQRGVWIQMGTVLDADARWPVVVFNTTCLIGPEGLLSRYRKVHTGLLWERLASSLDLPGFGRPLLPVVETEIGRFGAAI
jgi:predicted amidohydrolase